MSREPITRGYRIWLLAVSCVCASGALSLAGDVQVQVDGKAYAKGLLLLRATFPLHGEVAHVGLQYSRDGDEFQEAGIGLPRPWRLFSLASSNEEETAVLVPAVARFQIGEFRFGEAGTHYLRWSVGIKGVKGFNFEQVLELEPARAADLDFIAGLGDPDLARAMFGADFFERQTGNAVEHYADPEVRAVKVIGRLLAVTRENNSGQAIAWYGPRGDVRKAAEMLLALAKRIPESSYAPYAAYYAGCCFASMASERITEAIRTGKRDGETFRDTHTRLSIPLVKRNVDATTSTEAFRLASEYGDDYLKPRALYHLASSRAAAGEFKEANALLSEAEQTVPGEGSITKWTKDLRAKIAAMKERQGKR